MELLELWDQPAPPRRVLFLCTRNSARSQLAEALLARRCGGTLLVASAGAAPAARVNPDVVAVLAELGIDWSRARPKGLDAVADVPWDLVITTCDRLQERCPGFGGRPAYAHWGVPDPVGSDRGREAFREAARLLAWRIDLMLALRPEGPVRAATAQALDLTRSDRTAPPDGSRRARAHPLPDPIPERPAMRYALISDVHANLEALDAVLADIDARGDVEAVYHLGDLVGYSSHPNEVAARLRERAVPGIAGNYDSTVATDYKHCGCKSESPRQEDLAHISYEYTRRTVTPATKQYLAGLPFSLDLRPLGGHAPGPRLVLVHGTPTLNTVYFTEDRPDDFCRKMAAAVGLKAGDVLAFGHTHKPWHRAVDGIHFVNTGSVGRPKDGDPRAGYVLLDLGIGEAHDAPVRVEHVRVPYDVEATVAGVRAAGLPEDFVEFLRTGGQPAAVVA